MPDITRSGKDTRGRPPLRLVETEGLSRDDWLTVRRTGIGGSDAAAAVGLNPYMSQLELWLDKTGRDAGLARPDPHDTTEPVYWGTLLEPIVAVAYTRQTGNRVRRVNAVLQHPTIPFMLANIDRDIIGVPGVQILECKTAGEFGARLWRESVPEYVQLQVQHQLAVTGRHAADVAVLLCGQQLAVHRIERDDELIAHPLDQTLRKTEPGKPATKLRSIPVRLLFNDADLNLRADYSLFDRKTGRPVCVGNGETCRRVTDGGVTAMGCPTPDGCAFGEAGGCKPYGRLNVTIGDEDELGSFILRTTSYNSIRTLSARLHYFSAVSGGLLACLPLELKLRGKSTTQSFRSAIYYVDLGVRSGSSLEQAIIEAREVDG